MKKEVYFLHFFLDVAVLLNFLQENKCHFKSRTSCERCKNNCPVRIFFTLSVPFSGSVLVSRHNGQSSADNNYTTFAVLVDYFIFPNSYLDLLSVQDNEKSK